MADVSGVHDPSWAEVAHLASRIEGKPPSLAAFLAKAQRTRFELGSFDCLLWLADWIAANHGLDPAAHLRGTYNSPLGYMRYVRKAGGVAPLVASCVEPMLKRVGKPQPGDIGIVHAVTTDGFADVGAIRTARGWASLSPTGLLVGEAQATAAWRV